MNEPVIHGNEERVPVVLEEKTLIICSSCTKYYGEWWVTFECDAQCGEYFTIGQEVICSEGRHYDKDCFEQMKKDGLVDVVGGKKYAVFEVSRQTRAFKWTD